MLADRSRRHLFRKIRSRHPRRNQLRHQLQNARSGNDRRRAARPARAHPRHLYRPQRPSQTRRARRPGYRNERSKTSLHQGHSRPAWYRLLNWSDWDLRNTVGKLPASSELRRLAWCKRCPQQEKIAKWLGSRGKRSRLIRRRRPKSVASAPKVYGPNAKAAAPLLFAKISKPTCLFAPNASSISRWAQNRASKCSSTVVGPNTTPA